MLTPLAGVGLAMVMLLAMIFHISRGELGAVAMPLALGSLAAFVAWGRFGRGAHRTAVIALAVRSGTTMLMSRRRSFGDGNHAW